MATVIFSHGKESGPNGDKITVLTKVAQAHGLETIALDYRECKSATRRVDLLREYVEIKKSDFVILVGSSMGGYVTTVFANEYEPGGMFLMCPALYMSDAEYEVQSYSPRCDNIEIIHGWEDSVVPFESSIRFGKQTGAVLTLVKDDHPLKKSLDFIGKRFELFLQNMNF